jgi:Mg2+/citrate symporter
MTAEGKDPNELLKRLIAVSIISILLTVLFMSCAARTSEVNKSKSTEEAVIEKKDAIVVSTETNIEKKVEKEFSDKGMVVKEITTITAIDSSKDAFVDIPGEGIVKLVNSKYVNEKITSNANTRYYETLSLQEGKKENLDEKSGSSIAEEKEDITDSKDTARSSTTFYWLLVILLIGVALYVYYRISPGAKIFNMLKKK